MNSAKLAWGLAVCLAVPLCAGCAADQNVVRGQAPAPAMTAAPPAGAQVGPGAVDPAGCPGGCDNGTCDPHHCSPRHFYTSCYDAPYCNNCCLDHDGSGPMVYPPNPTPGAVVQYPYYMCKGPDDFFSPPLTGPGGAH
jgi:hypothetical protein